MESPPMPPERVCRTCLNQIDDGQSTAITDTEIRPLFDILLNSCKYLKLTIGIDDVKATSECLPTRICSQCTLELTSFGAFCQRAADADVQHRQKTLIECPARADAEEAIEYLDSSSSGAESDDAASDSGSDENDKPDGDASTATDDPSSTVCAHPGCGKTFLSPRLEQIHFERMHKNRQTRRPSVKNGKPSRNMCEECGESYRTRTELQAHMQTHLQVKEYPYECEFCGKRFTYKKSYELHVLRHKNIRNMPCPLRPSRMVSQLELNNHVANYDPSVSWPCSECPKVFHCKANLYRHEHKVHRTYTPFVCRFCSRAFGKKQALTNHERVHTGERPFACAVCDRRFVQLVHMQSHVKTHNKDKKPQRQPDDLTVQADEGTADDVEITSSEIAGIDAPSRSDP